MEDIRFKPTSNYIVFDIIERTDKKSVIIPLDKRRMPQDRVELIAVALGPEVKEIKIGDNILPDTSQSSLAKMIKIGEKEFGMIRESLILGVYQKDYQFVGTEETKN